MERISTNIKERSNLLELPTNTRGIYLVPNKIEFITLLEPITHW
jgi:hypothetical protein